MAAPVTRPRSASGEAASPDAVAVAVPASLLPAPLEESAVPLHPARLVEALPQSAPADDDGFYPLQPDAGRASLESGQIVRVRLRPDVLDAAGLPPRADGARGPVEAEVLIGPDGVARGIRLARPQR